MALEGLPFAGVSRAKFISTPSKSLGVLLLALMSVACTTHPDGMRLDLLGIELVPSARYIPARPKNELALAILFEGRAPFARIDAEGLQPQFRCELRDAAGKPVSETDFGWTYFDGPAMTVDPTTGLLPLNQNDAENKEKFKYRSVGYFDLKSKAEINGPNNLDLTRSDYDHVACRLIGVTMGPMFIASNDLVVSKQEIMRLAGLHH